MSIDEQSGTDREAAERPVAELFHAGKVDDAARAALLLYGSELQRFLQVRLRSSSAAEEAYAVLCEDFWRGFPSFQFRSSLRTWLFVLARNAASRVARSEQHERKKAAQLALDEQEARVRTTTALYRRTEIKRRVRALRELLDEDQQTLLVLRIDRSLSWNELAVVMGEVASDAPTTEVTRASARVRTRYQAAKQRLRELAREAGLLTDREDPG